MPALRHPQTNRTTNARDAQVPALLARGWEHVEPPEPPERTHATEIADGIEAGTPAIEEATARVRDHTESTDI